MTDKLDAATIRELLDEIENTQYDGTANTFQKVEGDHCEPNLSCIFALDALKIIWGAQNFYRQLPHRGRWICWHKRSPVTRPNSMPSSDFELAWMDAVSGFYKFVHLIHGGCVNDDSIFGNNEKRFHPTQKPVRLMRWCISLYPDAVSILDPFMGSGTTLRAAKDLGRKAIGIEIEERYCEIAANRLRQEVLQFD